MKVTRHSIYLKITIDSAPFLFVDVLNHLVQFLIIVHSAVIVSVIVGQNGFYETLLNVYEMHL